MLVFPRALYSQQFPIVEYLDCIFISASALAIIRDIEALASGNLISWFKRRMKEFFVELMLKQETYSEKKRQKTAKNLFNLLT